MLLHPLGADQRIWDPIVDRLKDRRELITVDMPGFGASPPLPLSDPTPARLAAAIAAGLSRLGVAQPHVAGNSLGGWVALELARLGAVASSTAIAPAGLWPGPLRPKPNAAHRLARAFLPLIGPIAATGAGRRLLLSSAVAHPDRVPAAASVHLIRAYARAPGFVSVNRAMRAGHFTDLAQITVPVTLVWCEHDGLIARPRHLPDHVTSIELAGAGHIPFWDAPDAVVEILLRATGG
ncbi:MAG TPA: alpha/beta fold hydrolase [Solirubrobacteraceae bacterium]|nr:alpha/beta fold hydrolase [Solirubrobacteraceae bacterium]